MRRGECHDLEVLIDREARGWSEAERLRVEQHLMGCPECREVLAASRFVRSTLRSAQGGLNELARERALKRAFVAAAATPARGAQSAPRVWGGALLALSAAAALLVWWSGGSDATRGPQALRPRTAPAAAPDRFVATETLAQAVDAGEGTAAAPAWIEAAAQQRHQFAHASVQLARGTRVRFEEASHTLVLASGRVEVDVDASRGQPFRVATQHFRVEVLGTRFAVSGRSVVVRRGHVQVFALDGRVLAADLAAGSAFSYDARDSAREQVEAGPRAREQVEARPPPREQVEARPPARELHPVDAGPAAREQQGAARESSGAQAQAAESASSWLARARQALAQGEPERALELVGRAEASAPGRSERAEAGTLRAEAALLGKQPAKAIDIYAAVAEQFADLPAGENAAFAAAQLAARSQPARERALLERYLALHPRGRFVDEARRRLARLAEP